MQIVKKYCIIVMATRLCYASALLVTIAIFAIMDGLWLGVLQKNSYVKQFEQIQGSSFEVKPLGAAVAYIAMILLILFVVVPRVSNEILVYSALTNGAIVGFLVYAVYNGTNYATLTNYSLTTAIKDTLWGTALFAVASLGASYAAHNWYLFK